MTLNPEQQKRYSRQIQLPQVGENGQQTLINSHAVILGCGGLGCPAAMYLTAAGIGKLSLVDYDLVELSNMQRQIAHRNNALGQLKTESLARTCREINPAVKIELHSEVMDDEMLDQLIKPCDVVLDCSDNFPTRFALNQACVNQGITLVSGAAARMEAQLAVFRNDKTDAPCYRCLFRDTDAAGEACDQVGVLSPLVGIIGSLQALEAIKVLLDIGQENSGQLLIYDALAFDWRKLKIPKDPKCPSCGKNNL